MKVRRGTPPTREIQKRERQFDRSQRKKGKRPAATTISTPNMQIEIVASEDFTADSHDEELPPDPTGDWI